MADIKEDIKNIITPSALEVSADYIKLGDKYIKTLFIFTYPRFLSTGWIAPIINMAELLDISIFISPRNSASTLKKLRRSAGEIEAQIKEQEAKGLVRNPVLETALHDIESLRDTLQQGQEGLFSVGVYITIYADDVRSLHQLEGKLTTLLEGKLIYAKSAIFRQIEGFSSTLPIGYDKLQIFTPLNSKTLSSFFPFVSVDLTSEQGIVYGINRYNNTLIIFDRFSLENANMVIFAKSGSGKSYTTKLEALRLLMTGINMIIIDPENEYERLAEAVGGSFFRISLSSGHHVNPFDIPIIPEGEEPADVLKSHFLTLTGLLKLMLGEISADESAILDRAISETYASREIVPGKDFSHAEPPILSDLAAVLKNMEGGRTLGDRLYKYTEGTFAGFINNTTNIDIQNRFIVFSIRDLEDELRPVAMYIILNFIWNLVRAEVRKRILIVDEAWWMMKYEDGASFLFGLVKRCRKYFLGVSTITQDVEDFLRSPFGRPIITNSSMQILLKQSPSTVDLLAKTFNLTDGEKTMLLEVNVGQGIFSAGLKRTAIQIVASYLEDKIITTNPEQLLREQKDAEAEAAAEAAGTTPQSS
ncbi:MAG: conjugal transfer protein TraC [Candidatus Harrisonbacteria bacterium CG10_big_fil_rev_8_21_14_0_10_42_17]|uniref:Conjugal transfer protein TraC n=1 Tax=Candidatus Harrisonbacteria bacterium CG10_big_fil_rev_8_21_14_0_10_42_17 TaxID=1974584 RepID=A0A2M6WIU3_9BACT|nr:MAG: conjugal transfer protein TraC [Candidatus Harrisonbacteria bacterium CG10_big_fil_rev_8_21_14_0_10_42_17]